MNDKAKLITKDSLNAEAMGVLLDSEYGHFGALAVYALELGAKAAAAVQVLGTIMVASGLSADEVDDLIRSAETIENYEQIKREVGDICVANTVRQWNYEIAGVEDDPETRPQRPVFNEETEELLKAMIQTLRESR